MQRQRSGPHGSPTALETHLGWVLAGGVYSGPPKDVVSHHICTLPGDNLLQKFWELEERVTNDPVLSPEEKEVLNYFHDTHSCSDDGRFIVPLPSKGNTPQLGESAVRRFLSLEQSFTVALELTSTTPHSTSVTPLPAIPPPWLHPRHAPPPKYKAWCGWSYIDCDTWCLFRGVVRLIVACLMVLGVDLEREAD